MKFITRDMHRPLANKTIYKLLSATRGSGWLQYFLEKQEDQLLPSAEVWATWQKLCPKALCLSRYFSDFLKFRYQKSQVRSCDINRLPGTLLPNSCHFRPHITTSADSAEFVM